MFAIVVSFSLRDEEECDAHITIKEKATERGKLMWKTIMLKPLVKSRRGNGVIR